MDNLKKTVANNIKQAVADGDFHRKVEVGDPVLSDTERNRLLANYLESKQKLPFKIKTYLVRQIINAYSVIGNLNNPVSGIQNIPSVHNGAIITCNHFSKLDTTMVKKAMRKNHLTRIAILSEITNFKMTGMLGFLMNYNDTIPVSTDKEYLGRNLPQLIQNELMQNHLVLIYPEEELWENYRKPRKPMRGPYYYAARFKVPIISCFAEIIDQNRATTGEFDKVNYHMHVLKTIYPDPQKSVRDNSNQMMKTDFEQKKAAYEQIYHKTLSYTFEIKDIAGWHPTEQNAADGHNITANNQDGS